jgi:hypothetical protein
MIVTAEVLADPIKSEFVKHRPGDPCFRCGDKLSVPFVMWSGLDGNEKTESTEIALHTSCAQALGANLIADGTNAEGHVETV